MPIVGRSPVFTHSAFVPAPTEEKARCLRPGLDEAAFVCRPPLRLAALGHRTAARDGLEAQPTQHFIQLGGFQFSGGNNYADACGCGFDGEHTGTVREAVALAKGGGLGVLPARHFSLDPP